jgi:tRNA nucleotidyltransferase (CCA-adding enzyme)
VATELNRGPVLDRSTLAIGGSELIEELGLEPGPRLGRVLDGLVERVIDDPTLNDAGTLLLLARQLTAEDA